MMCSAVLPAGGAAKVVTAADLAAADVVLTSYDVLRRDVNHCPDAGSEEAGAGHSLRGRKKYEVQIYRWGTLYCLVLPCLGRFAGESDLCWEQAGCQLASATCLIPAWLPCLAPDDPPCPALVCSAHPASACRSCPLPSPACTGGGCAWMRLRWWRAARPRQLRWPSSCRQCTDGGWGWPASGRVVLLGEWAVVATVCVVFGHA